MTEEKIKERFPNIYYRCIEEGYNPVTDLLPVTPAQHYLMGGVKVDMDGQTSMDGLFAVGEASCNGVHGANRLASNSLLESLVFSKRAAHLIKQCAGTIPIPDTVINLNKYVQPEAIQAEYHQLVRGEIEKRSVKVYAKWCNYAG